VINSINFVPFRTYHSLSFKFWTLLFWAPAPPPCGAQGQRTILGSLVSAYWTTY